MRKACIVLFLLAVACGRDEPPGSADSVTVAGDTAAPGAGPAASSGWDEGAGPVLLVAGERPGDVLVIYPQVQGEDGPDTLDVADYTGASATLVSRNGIVGKATLGSATELEDSACVPWPRVSTPPGTPSWTVGFVLDQVDAIGVDSVAGMAPRDSARFVADIARRASALPAIRAEEGAESFHGLPFVVNSAVRFTHADTQVAVAHVMRRVNVEANPLEEHTLLVLERGGGDDQWTVAHSDHAVGPEDTVMRTELLGVVRLRGRLTLVLALDGGDGVAYALLQRSGAGKWRQVWRSADPGC